MLLKNLIHIETEKETFNLLFEELNVIQLDQPSGCKAIVSEGIPGAAPNK